MPTSVARISYARGIINTRACRVPTLIGTNSGHSRVRTHYAQNKLLKCGKRKLDIKVYFRMFKIIYDGLFHELVLYYLLKLGALERLRPKRESMCQNFGV